MKSKKKLDQLNEKTNKILEELREKFRELNDVTGLRHQALEEYRKGIRDGKVKG